MERNLDLFLQNVKNLKDTELVLIKCHLFLETCIYEGIGNLVEDIKCVDEMRLMFNNKRLMLNSLLPNVETSYWQFCITINKVRNSMAHRLDYDRKTILSDISKAAANVLGYSVKSRNNKTINNQIIKATMFVGGLLVGHSSGKSIASRLTSRSS